VGGVGVCGKAGVPGMNGGSPGKFFGSIPRGGRGRCGGNGTVRHDGPAAAGFAAGRVLTGEAGVEGFDGYASLCCSLPLV